MTIKPIDLQTNIAHLHEIAKAEQIKSAVFIEREHSLEKDAEEEANRIRSKLEKNKHAEKTSIMREEGYKGKKEKHLKKDNNDNNESLEGKKDFLKNEKMGLNIDVKR